MDVTHAPHVVQSKILSYFQIRDAIAFALTCKDNYEMVTENRVFWTAKARHLHERDPMLFMRLRDPTEFELPALIKHVSRGQNTFEEIEENLRLGNHYEKWLHLNSAVRCMDVDEKNCLLAVYLRNDQLRIYPLLRFGDPPYRVLDAPEMDRITLHGDIVFHRPPVCPSTYHTDITNWNIKLDMASLQPDLSSMGEYDLKKSDHYIAAYNEAREQILAYPLSDNGLDINPISVAVPPDTQMTDFALRQKSVLFILTKMDEHRYVEVDIRSNVILREFRVAAPAILHTPKLAYPHILVNITPKISRETTYYVPTGVLTIMGARICLLGNNQSARMHNRITGGNTLHNTSQTGNFAFFPNFHQSQTGVAYVGNSDTFPHPCRTSVTPPRAFAPFGLSYLYANQNVVSFRRFYTIENSDIFLDWIFFRFSSFVCPIDKYVSLTAAVARSSLPFSLYFFFIALITLITSFFSLPQWRPYGPRDLYLRRLCFILHLVIHKTGTF